MKYTICQKRVEIIEKLTVAAFKVESSNNEVESDDDPESEDESEIGKESNSYEKERRQDGYGMSFSE